MKISELIEKLEELGKEHGDMDVFIRLPTIGRDEATEVVYLGRAYARKYIDAKRINGIVEII